MSSIHLKFDYDSALNAKRDILFSEKSILSIIKHIKNYIELRKLEYALKNRLRVDIAELKKEVTILEESMPREDFNSIRKKYQVVEPEYEEEAKPKIIEPKKIKKTDIEEQLEDIARKLAALG